MSDRIFSPRRRRKGDPIAADDRNARDAALARNGRLSGTGGLVVREGSANRALALITPETANIKLTTTANGDGGYGAKEVLGAAAGTWIDSGRTMPQSGDPCYERNHNVSLASGDRVYLARRAVTTGEWIFAHRVASGGCGGSSATVTVTVNICGYARPGVTVNAVQGATTISGTTDSSGQVALSLTSAGSWTISPVSPSARVNGGSSTITVSCGTSYTATFNLTAATGFHCVSGCWEPLPNTLYLSDACTASTGWTEAAGNYWQWYSDCPTLPSDTMLYEVYWVATTPSTGHWRLDGSVALGGLPAISWTCVEADHDPADAVSVTFTGVSTGTDPAVYWSPWNITFSE